MTDALEWALARVPQVLRQEVAEAWSQLSNQGGLPEDRHFIAAVLRVWACSVFVRKQCQSHPGLLRELLDDGRLHRDQAAGEYRSLANQAVHSVGDRAQLATALRQLRNREMVRIIFRDLNAWAGLSETLRDLSCLADACVAVALERLQRWQEQEYGVPRDESGRAVGFAVIAMGKHGARELNLSSDIDLIFVYGREGQTDRKRRALSNTQYFTRLGQALIEALAARTGEGFVYRVDMRLRPFGDAGPLAASLDAVEDYYQSQGRDWERYAMIKARVVAGELALGDRLQSLLRPFVYRRYLDFDAFEALRGMKAMIARQVKRRGMEDNIKLGPGGIREIEFIGQAFQLVRGGREPALRRRAIVPVLEGLARLNILPQQTARDLIDAYRFLRQVENCLQAVADEQVHALPQETLERQRLAYAMRCPDWDSLRDRVDRHRAEVQSHFEQVFAPPVAGGEEQEDAEQRMWRRLWEGGLAEEQAMEHLAAAGYDDPAATLHAIRDLRSSHALRRIGPRGNDRLNQLMPRVLQAAARTTGSSATFYQLGRMIETIALRTAYLSLLLESPTALNQLVQLCGASAWIALLLREHPLLLDELLDPRSLYAPLQKPALREELAEMLRSAGDDQELQMEALRHFKQANVLRVAAADVAEVAPLMVVSDHLTHIAESVLEAVLAMAWQTLLQREGVAARERRAGSYGGFAVVAYGKLGGIELGYGSDLDLVFLYDQSHAWAQRLGQEAGGFYARLAQRIIHLLNTVTSSGVLYEVDVRLRPSGSSGFLVSSLDSFADYQREQAWTWEHQALVRARAVAGEAETMRGFEQLRQDVLCQSRDEDDLRREVSEMRERMRRELSKDRAGRFDLKQGRGGMTDIEFLVQYAVLRDAHRHPDLVEFSDNIRQIEALERHRLLGKRDGRFLTDTYRVYRRRVHQLTLQELPTEAADEEFADERARVTALWERWLGEP